LHRARLVLDAEHQGAELHHEGKVVEKEVAVRLLPVRDRPGCVRVRVLIGAVVPADGDPTDLDESDQRRRDGETDEDALRRGIPAFVVLLRHGVPA
jgi:hypothetical protein